MQASRGGRGRGRAHQRGTSSRGDDAAAAAGGASGGGAGGQDRKRKRPDAAAAVTPGALAGAAGAPAAAGAALQPWLAAIRCEALLAPLDALGADTVDDLLELDPEDLDALRGQLKKLQAKKFDQAIQALQEAGVVPPASPPPHQAAAAASAAKHEGASKRRRKKMEEANTCPICLDVAVLPVTLQCGHSGCRPCFTRIAVQGAGRPCPQCRKVHSGSLEVSINMRAVLEAEMAGNVDYDERLVKAVAAHDTEKAATKRALDAEQLRIVGAAAAAAARAKLEQGSRAQLSQRLDARGLSRGPNPRDPKRGDTRRKRIDRLRQSGLGGIRGVEIGTQIEVPNYGRAVVLDFKRAHFRVQYTSGTQRSLKRAEFLRYYAASLE